ncbi:MAG TPA: hypothetical protein VMV59_10770 [Candidatus Dormibacteraeota bacterium]|nr:hypothetical protein [Candidatus Dormibacteraeota bacterium]
MNAPLIGMSFGSFIVLLVVSGIAASIIHWGFRYRLFQGLDGCIGQWMVAWVGAWLGPAVLGHWFGSAMVEGIYVIPAFLGALAGAFGGTVNANVLAGVASQRGMS